MKVRSGYVSNSSSSSFIVHIDKNKIENFKHDFNKFQSYIKEIFPQFENENFYFEIKSQPNKQDIIIDYIKNNEGVKKPSKDLIEFFSKKLEDNEGIFWRLNKIEVEYIIDDECYDTLGFQNLCGSFIENYGLNIK